MIFSSCLNRSLRSSAGGLRVIPLMRTATAQSKSVAYVYPSAWSCLPQYLQTKLLSLSPLLLWKYLKTFLLRGPSTGAPWEHCWFEWCYTIIWLHYITLSPSLFRFLFSDSVWNAFLFVRVLFVTDLGRARLWITEWRLIDVGLQLQGRQPWWPMTPNDFSRHFKVCCGQQSCTCVIKFHALRLTIINIFSRQWWV